MVVTPSPVTTGVDETSFLKPNRHRRTSPAAHRRGTAESYRAGYEEPHVSAVLAEALPASLLATRRRASVTTAPETGNVDVCPQQSGSLSGERAADNDARRSCGSGGADHGVPALVLGHVRPPQVSWPFP